MAVTRSTAAERRVERPARTGRQNPRTFELIGLLLGSALIAAALALVNHPNVVVDLTWSQLPVHFFRRSVREPEVRLETASSAEEGIAKVKSEKPNVVVLDVNLAGKSGLDVFRQIEPDGVLNVREFPAVFYLFYLIF